MTEPREKPNIKERRFSVIERRGSIVEALGNKQEWMEFLEKLKNGLGDAFMQGNNKKRKISMVGQPSQLMPYKKVSNIVGLWAHG